MPHRSYTNLTEGKIARLRDGSFALVGRQMSNKGTALRGEESMSHNGRCVQRCSTITASRRLRHNYITSMSCKGETSSSSALNRFLYAIKYNMCIINVASTVQSRSYRDGHLLRFRRRTVGRYRKYCRLHSKDYFRNRQKLVI